MVDYHEVNVRHVIIADLMSDKPDDARTSSDTSDEKVEREFLALKNTKRILQNAAKGEESKN